MGRGGGTGIVAGAGGGRDDGGGGRFLEMMGTKWEGCQCSKLLLGRLMEDHMMVTEWPLESSAPSKAFVRRFTWSLVLLPPRGQMVLMLMPMAWAHAWTVIREE